MGAPKERVKLAPRHILGGLASARMAPPMLRLLAQVPKVARKTALLGRGKLGAPKERMKLTPPLGTLGTTATPTG